MPLQNNTGASKREGGSTSQEYGSVERVTQGIRGSTSPAQVGLALSVLMLDVKRPSTLRLSTQEGSS